MSTTRHKRIRELIEQRAERLGLSFEELAKTDRETGRYAGAADVEGPTRSLRSMLNEAIGFAVASPYPTPSCLLPSEVEEVFNSDAEHRVLPAYIASHLENCPFCASLARPSGHVSNGFLTHLRALVAEAAQPTQDSSAFSDWLSQPQRTENQLAAWLVDPRAIEEREPEQLVDALLSAVLQSDRADVLQKELARRLAVLIGHDPNFRAQNADEYAFVNRPLVSRALQLAAAIAPTRELFEVLWALLERSQSFIEGIGLTTLLRRALIAQQTDNRMLPELELTVKQESHPVLRGDPIEAYQGMLTLYSHRTPSTADRELLCKELGAIASYLEKHFGPSRRQRFAQLLSSSLHLISWPIDTWELVLMAHRFGWPRWAVQCLPNLFAIKTGHGLTEQAEVLAWQPLAYVILGQASSAQLESLCQGEVIRVSLPHAGIDIVNNLGLFLDTERGRYVFQSSRACRAVATGTLREFVSSRYPGMTDLERSVDEASCRVLRESDIGATLPSAVDA